MFDLFASLETLGIDRPDGTRLALLAAVPDGEPHGTVLCLHGFTGAKEDYLFALAALRDEGYATYALDARGVHDSRSPGPFDLDTLADDVVAVAKQLAPGGVHLVAHSFGGLVAQRAVIARRKRFASLTLVCSGPAGFRHSADLIPVTIDRVSTFADALVGRTLAQAWDMKTAHENVEMPDAMASFLKARFVAGSYDAAVRNVADVMAAPDVVDEVVRSGVPAYVLYGDNDGTWSQRSQNEMAERLGNSPVVVPEATHLPFLENVDAFVERFEAILDDAASRDTAYREARAERKRLRAERKAGRAAEREAGPGVGEVRDELNADDAALLRESASAVARATAAG